MKFSLYNLGWLLIVAGVAIGVAMFYIVSSDMPNITALQYMLGGMFALFWAGTILIVGHDEIPGERRMRRAQSTRRRSTALMITKRDIRRIRGKATRFDNWRNDREFKRIQKGLMSTYV